MQKQDDLIFEKNCRHNRHTQLQEMVINFGNLIFSLTKIAFFYFSGILQVEKKRAPLLGECVRFSAYPDLPWSDYKKAEHF